MIILKSTHEAKVAVLEQRIAILEESTKAKDAIIRQRGEEQDSLMTFLCTCLTLLHEIEFGTRTIRAKALQERRIHLFEEAQELGLWPIEEKEEAQDATE